MANLSVIKEVKIETFGSLNTLVISSNGSVVLRCLACGGIKSLDTYMGAERDVIAQNTYTCSCFAPNPGGDNDVLNSRELDERRAIAHIYNAETLKEMRLRVPVPFQSPQYSVAFYQLMDKIHQAQSAEEARTHIVRYASIAEQRGEI